MSINVMGAAGAPCGLRVSPPWRAERTVKLAAAQTGTGLDGSPPGAVPVTASSWRRVCHVRTQRSFIMELREQGP